MSTTTDGTVLLAGLDGSNLLALLAALGTLRTLTIALPDEKVRMAWEQSGGAWRPRAFCSLAANADALIARLDTVLRQGADCASFKIGDNLNLQAGAFRSLLLAAVERPEELHTHSHRANADFLAAFGSEAITDDKGLMSDTALRTMGGGGHQDFLKFMRNLVAQTDASHLRRALLDRWDYADDGRSLNMRWDPADDRRYAVRWDNPSSDPIKTMRGANRLAIEALPLFPTMPTAQGLATTCCQGSGSRDTWLIWPIWTRPLTLEVVRSLLANSVSLRGDGAERRAQGGVAEMFGSQRINPTPKYRNFSPARPV